MFHVFELSRCDQRQRSGVEDGLFLLHQVARMCYNLLLCSDKLIVFVVQQQLISSLYLVPNEVIKVPHRRRWTVETLLFEQRIELILLALIVYWILTQLVIKLQPLVLDERILHQILHREEQFAHLIILFIIMCDRMIGRKFRSTVVHKTVHEVDDLTHIHTYTLVFRLWFEGLFHVSKVIRTHRSHLFTHQFMRLFK